MPRIVLEPPFDHAILNELVDGHSIDASVTARWLLRFGTRVRMTQELKTAWAQSSLPLASWSERICTVAAYTTETGSRLGLEVSLSGPNHRRILQSAPFDPCEFDAYQPRTQKRIPQVIRRVALAAPGLQLDDVGQLLPPRYILTPMAEMMDWVTARDVTPELCAEYGCVFPDPDHFLMEIANNGQGCCYVLQENGSLFYHEYGDLPGLLACSVGLDSFIRTYFDSPESIINPYENGWIGDG